MREPPVVHQNRPVVRAFRHVVRRIVNFVVSLVMDEIAMDGVDLRVWNQQNLSLTREEGPAAETDRFGPKLNGSLTTQF